MRIRRLQNLTLNVKVSLLLITAFVILLAAVTIVLVVNITTLTSQVSHERTVQETSLIQAQFQEFNKSLLNTVQILVGAQGIGDAVSASNADHLKTALLVALKDVNIDQASVYDASGKLILHQFQNAAIPDDVVPGRLISLALIGVNVTELVPQSRESTPSGSSMVAMAAAPVNDATGNVVGVIIAEKEVNNNVLQQINFGRSDIQLSLLYRGSILASTADNRVDSGPLSGNDGVQQAVNGQVWISPAYISDSVGHLQSLAYVPIQIGRNTEAIAVLQVYLDNLFSFQQTVVRSTLLVVGALALGTMLFIIIFMRLGIVDPLRQLTAVTRTLSGGDYSTRAPVTSADEIGQLAGSFNGMADQIKGLIDNLEQRVRETQAARERAERSDQVKSAFLASMSHELRTPLNAVINFTQFVIDGDVGPVSEEQGTMLSEVVGSAKHLLNLINDVLDMSKIEADSLRLFVEDNISLADILTNVASIGRGLLANKPVELHTSISDNLPMVRGDRQRIYQILLNVVSNACKFTEEGEVKLSAHESDNEIVFEIADTGPGIPAHEQSLVFAAFKQTTAGLSQGGGTGLGMPIAKSLAEAHGGRLWLESTPGKGSTFYIALPIKSNELVPQLT
ncbi:MAG TPA: HAMP domain-containing sensor histidine kinase [Aggregatilineales bacterium]|nr:HAMP domain-containing sensor histidine kinase [Aggregatilineales bacterium]